MIELYDGYAIMVDTIQYTLVKKSGSTDKRTGRPIYEPQGYYSDLRSAIKAFGRINVRRRLSDGLQGLSGALQAITEECDRLEKFIADNIPEA